MPALRHIREPPTSRGALSSKLETSRTAGLGGAETVYAGFADLEARAGNPPRRMPAQLAFWFGP